MNVYPHIGQLLRQLRTSHRIPIEYISAQLQVPAKHLLAIEAGTQLPAKHQLLQLASQYDADASVLLSAYLQERIHQESTERSRNSGNSGTLPNRLKAMHQELALLSTNQVGYRLERPGGCLSPYVESVIYSKGSQLTDLLHHTVPDGTTQLIIDFSEHPVYLIRSRTNAQPDATDISGSCWVTGIQRTALINKYSDRLTQVIVRFRPGALSLFTPVPQRLLADQCLPAEAVFGPGVHVLWDQVAHAADAKAALSAVSGYLAGLLSPEPTGYAAAAHVAQQPQAPLGQVIADTGYSAKHFIERFKQFFGLTPKELQRIRRLAASMTDLELASSGVNWPEMACRHGYYDQAHFIREFRTFLGMTPNEYLRSGQTCSRYLHTTSHLPNTD